VSEGCAEKIGNQATDGLSNSRLHVLVASSFKAHALTEWSVQVYGESRFNSCCTSQQFTGPTREGDNAAEFLDHLLPNGIWGRLGSTEFLELPLVPIFGW